MRLYSGGEGIFYSILDGEWTLLEAESTLANAAGQVSKDQIEVFMALGGGWQDAPDVQDATAQQVCRSNCTDPLSEWVDVQNRESATTSCMWRNARTGADADVDEPKRREAGG